MEKPPAGAKGPVAAKGKAAPIRGGKKTEETDAASPADNNLASTLPHTEGAMDQPAEDDAAAFLLDQEHDEDEGTITPGKGPSGGSHLAATELDEKGAEEDDSSPPAASVPNQLDATQAFNDSTPEEEEASSGHAPLDQGATQAFTEEEEEAAAKPAKAPAKPTQGKATVLGDFRLIKKLGQGGMGSVFKALQLSLDREVALKVLSKELANRPGFVERFQREAKIMAKLDHAHILRCFGAGKDKGYHYLAIEFVEGGSVEDWLKKRGRFSIGDALHIVLACSHALQYAHELKLIHRDIKPDNLLLTRRGAVKVADLGLAKATDDDLALTKTGAGAGTPMYMAPEQARDAKHVDHRVDIYAMGVMLYVFLTGEFPFKGQTLVEVISAKDKGKFTPVRHFNAEVPEKLGLIIDKMVAAKPEHRYQSCAEVVLALDSLGLANKHLSFFEQEGPPPKVDAPPPPPKKVSFSSIAATGATEMGPGTSVPAPVEEANDIWYVQSKGEGGKTIVKKVHFDQLVTLVKSKSFDPETLVSRARKEGYRALASFKEFQPLLKAATTKEKAERKGEKFKAIYKQIEKEETRRLRWRWLENLYLRAGGGVIFLLYLAIVVAIVGGLGYLFWQYGLPAITEYFRKVTAS